MLFVSANNAGFARLLDDVDSVVTLPVRDIPAAVKLFGAERCDVVVDFGAWPRLESLFAVMAHARCTIGMRTPGQHRHYAYDVVVDHGTGHEIDNYRRLIAGAGIVSASDPVLHTDPAAPRPLAAPYVVLHLWPGGANFHERSWPTDRWRSVAAAMNDRGFEVVLTGGPGDVVPTDALVTAWRATGIRARSVAGTKPSETLVWLRYAAGVVSVNTGVMHLAAAVGAPIVALNGPTPVRRWGPVGSASRSVVSPLIPDGYLDLGWEHDDRYEDAIARDHGRHRPRCVGRSHDRGRRHPQRSVQLNFRPRSCSAASGGPHGGRQLAPEIWDCRVARAIVRR